MSDFDQRQPPVPPVPPRVTPPPPLEPQPPPASGSSDSDAKERGKQAAGAAAEQGRNVAGDAADQGRQVAETASAGAHQVAGDAAREAQNVIAAATDEGRRLVDEATSELRSQANTQTDRLSEGLKTLSGQLNKAGSGESLDDGPVRDLASEAGSTLDKFAQRLADGGVDGVADDLSSFARRRPGAFLAGAATLGFFAGRMLRGAQRASKDQQPSVPSGAAQGQIPATTTSAPHVDPVPRAEPPVVVVDRGPAGAAGAGPAPSSPTANPTGGRL